MVSNDSGTVEQSVGPGLAQESTTPQQSQLLSIAEVVSNDSGTIEQSVSPSPSLTQESTTPQWSQQEHSDKETMSEVDSPTSTQESRTPPWCNVMLISSDDEEKSLDQV